MQIPYKYSEAACEGRSDDSDYCGICGEHDDWEPLSGLPKSEQGPFAQFYRPRREEYERAVREEVDGDEGDYVIATIALGDAEDEWKWMSEVEKQPYREAWMQKQANHSRAVEDSPG